MGIAEAVKRNVTIPNMLTLLRIAVIVPMSECILEEKYIHAGILLAVSALSALFDGMIARKFHQVTQLGKILDPIADKLTLIAVVICLNRVYPYVHPFVTVMFVKEAVMLTGGAFLMAKNIKPPAAQWFGKVATAVFYVSMTVLVALRAFWKIHLSWLSILLFGLSAGCMLFALMNYVSIFMELLKENGNKNENQKFL